MSRRLKAISDNASHSQPPDFLLHQIKETGGMCHAKCPKKSILIFREPAAIVPLAYHLPFAAGLNQFGKPAAKQFLRRLHPLDIVNPHPLIERME